MAEKRKKQVEPKEDFEAIGDEIFAGDVISPEAEAGPVPESATMSPTPEAVEKFETLMAEETRRAPAPPRTLEPFDVEKMIREQIVLPAEASLEFKTGLLVFRIPPDEERNYVIEAVIMACDRATAEAALDAAILAAEPEKTRRHDGAAFFLHAVQHSRPKSTQISLRYIFRLRPSEA